MVADTLIGTQTYKTYVNLCSPKISQTNLLCDKEIDLDKTRIYCCDTDNCNNYDYLALSSSSADSIIFNNFLVIILVNFYNYI